MQQKWAHLSYGVIVIILKRKERRVHQDSTKERWLSVSSVGNKVLKHRTSASRLTPDCDFLRIPSKRRYLLYQQQLTKQHAC